VVSARRLVVAVALAGGAWLAPTAARAQGSPAQTQFDFGLAEMQAGRYASGCPALAESYRIDPHPGVLFTLAECENKWGKIASALTHYEAYLDLFSHMAGDEKGRQRGRDRIAVAQRDLLRSDVPQLAIALPASAPAGTTVTRDGAPLGAPSIGAALPVDPGEHLVVARTPDGVAHEAHVTLARGEHRAFVVDLSAPPRPPASPVASSHPPESPRPAPAPPRSKAWEVPAGIGIVGLLVGGVAGATVLHDKSTIESQCHPDYTCSQSGLNAASNARTFGVVSDVGIAVGAVGIVVANVLLALPAPKGPVQPVAAPTEHGGIVGARVAW
jgi:hypothetical protein